VSPHYSAPTGQGSQSLPRSAGNNASGDTVSPVKSPASGQPSTTTIPIPAEDVKDQLPAAGTKTSTSIQEGLRQRKSGNSERGSNEEDTPTARNITLQRAPVEGVPVQIVAALCLISFLLAYFFF
jgi:hypothetical protein